MASSKSSALTYDMLLRQIKSGPTAPLYLLHGEEGYFIDALVDALVETVPEADRDFNLYVFYAPETDMATVADACRRYPMMSDRLMVIVKETQAIPARDLEKIVPYINHLTPTTTLVLASRGEKCKSKEVEKAVKAAGGVEFLSEKVKNPSDAIRHFVTGRGLTIEPKGLAMLTDYVGSDLSRLYNEIAKLTVALPQGACVTPEVIEHHIGMSREFNTFELIKAFATRDAMMVFRILAYFRANPKNNNPIPIVATIWNFYANLLVLLYAKDKSPAGQCAALKMRWVPDDYAKGQRNYNAWQLIDIIRQLRRADAEMKGNGSRQDPYDILHRLAHRILSTTGR
ncbi:MAG: DNA polymerase III subunit delta [Muribaculum sp.]|nr:DNA polymerase III subunit delta [Muribaculum sp.]